ncbi:MAG: BPSS1780 family membrane protein [Burkholderiales bacterium]
MQVRTLPAAHGWLWILHGFSLFRAHPALWLLLLIFYWLVLLLAGSIPLVGPLLGTALIPGLAAGFMVACRAVQEKKPPLPAQLLGPLKSNTRPQLLLGALYLGALALVLAVVALADAGALFRIMLMGAKVSRQSIPELQTSAFLGIMLYAPVMLAFWFAPALTLWEGMTPAKSLFFSFFAGWRNLKAFLVYGLGWILFAVIVPMIIGLIVGALVPRQGSGASMVALIIMPYMLAVMCAMICSFYSSYVAIFAPGEDAPADALAEKAEEPPPPPAP